MEKVFILSLNRLLCILSSAWIFYNLQFSFKRQRANFGFKKLFTAVDYRCSQFQFYPYEIEQRTFLSLPAV